jgi:hypothetical protein
MMKEGLKAVLEESLQVMTTKFYFRNLNLLEYFDTSTGD